MYRGMRKSYDELVDGYAGYRMGNTFQFLGFTSTSYSMSKTRDFLGAGPRPDSLDGLGRLLPLQYRALRAVLGAAGVEPAGSRLAAAAQARRPRGLGAGAEDCRARRARVFDVLRRAEVFEC